MSSALHACCIVRFVLDGFGVTTAQDCTFYAHIICCKFLVGGPVLTAVGIYILILGGHQHLQQQIAQLNAYGNTWNKDQAYGYRGFQQLPASVSMSIVQDSGGGGNTCSPAALALAYTADLVGASTPADTLEEYPSGLESWAQWKLTAQFPPPIANASPAYMQGCALSVNFYNGRMPLHGSQVGSISSPLMTYTTYSQDDLQCGPYTPCSAASSSAVSTSSNSLLYAGAGPDAGGGGAGLSLVAFRHYTVNRESCAQTPCQQACASLNGAWDTAADACTVLTGLRALCLRASPQSASQPPVYADNNTAPAPATGDGCFLSYGQFQPYQQGLISPGASNWTIDIMLRSAQDPYLEFLVLTSGGPFAPDTKVLTVVGAILLSVGVLFMGGMLLTICLCCICIRRALRRNSGLTYHQSVAYRIAQRYRLPLGAAPAQYTPPPAPTEQQMVNAPYGYQQQPQPYGPGGPPYGPGYQQQGYRPGDFYQPQGYGYADQPQGYGYNAQFQQPGNDQQRAGEYMEREGSQEQQPQHYPPSYPPVTGYPAVPGEYTIPEKGESSGQYYRE